MVCGLVSLLSFDICRLISSVSAFVVVGCFCCYYVCCVLFVVAWCRRLFFSLLVVCCLLLFVVWRCLLVLGDGCLLCVVVYGFVLRVACWLVLFLVVSVCRLLCISCCALFCVGVV